MEEGKGERYLASGRQYGNALLGVRHQEEDAPANSIMGLLCWTMECQNNSCYIIQRLRYVAVINNPAS